MAGRDDQVADRAYDEAIPVETDDEELSTPASSEAGSPSASSSPAKAQPRASPPGDGASPPRGPGGPPREEGAESGSESDSSEGSSTSESSAGAGESGTVDDKGAGLPAGAYNPDDYKGLKVSPDVEELFQYITRYKPHTIDLDTSFKPFVPELIPSIGEVDAFLKFPRPDGDNNDGLGTVKLDEPTLNPSDPSILDLQLRSLSKAQDLQPMEVRSIEAAEKNPKEIEMWVKRIEDLNRSKPAPTVQYSRRMPDIEQLMQVWPAEFEELLQETNLPDIADLELDLPNYVRIIASILDVPVHSQLTESLHVIFTLYSEFKTNQHFAKADSANFGQADQYNFDNLGGGNMQGGASGMMGHQFMGAQMESMAPSRAPSPAGR